MPSDIKELIEKLYSRTARTRLKAAYALGRMGAKALPAIPFLLPLLADDTPLLDGGLLKRTPGEAASFAINNFGRQAVKPLLSVLQDKNPTARLNAVMALGSIYERTRDDRIVPAIIRSLSDGEWKVREKSAFVLGKVGVNPEVADALIKALADENEKVRARAAYSLGKIGDKRAIPSLVDLLKDFDSQVRFAAVYSISRIRDPEAIKGLIQAIRDGDEELRKLAERELLYHNSPYAYEPLLDALKDDDWYIRMTAIRILKSTQNEPRVEDYFIAALKDDNGKVRVSAAKALKFTRNASAEAPLIGIIKDEKWPDRQHAIYALRNIGNKEAVSCLIAALKDQDKEIREAAVSVLGDIYGRIEDPRIVEPIIDSFKDPEPEVRAAAAGALARFGNQSMDALILVLEDKDINVKLAAIRSLRSIDNPGAVDLLLPLLEDTNMDVRIEAINALASIRDPKAVEPIMAIVRKRNDTDYYSMESFNARMKKRQEDSQKIVNELDKLCDKKTKDIAMLNSAVAAFEQRRAGGHYSTDLDRIKKGDDIHAAIKALGRFGDVRAAELLIKIIKSENEGSKRRRLAAESLGSISDPSIGGALIEALRDPDEYVRGAAAASLGRIKCAGAFEPLIDMLQDSSGVARGGAATGLGLLGESGAVDPLISALKDQNPYVREKAGKALGEIKDCRAVPALIGMFKDKHWKVGSATQIAFIRITKANFVVSLHPNTSVFEKWSEKNYDVCVEMNALDERIRNNAGPHDFETLGAAVNDKNPYRRERAVYGLGLTKSEHAKDFLTLALEDEDADVRKAAASVLRNFKGPELVQSLITSLNDEDQEVRAAAASSLGRIGDSLAVAPLTDCLADGAWKVRRDAITALGAIGDPTAIMPLILTLEREKNRVDTRNIQTSNTKASQNVARKVQRQPFKYRKDSVDVYILKALKKLTGKNFGEDARMWREWYEFSTYHSNDKTEIWNQ